MDTVIKVGSTESRWISRTVGLPGLPVEKGWLEPWGYSPCSSRASSQDYTS